MPARQPGSDPRVRSARERAGFWPGAARGRFEVHGVRAVLSASDPSLFEAALGVLPPDATRCAPGPAALPRARHARAAGQHPPGGDDVPAQALAVTRRAVENAVILEGERGEAELA